LLHWACSSDVPPFIIGTLLRHGADPLATDVKGRTPLHYLLKKFSKTERLEIMVRDLPFATIQKVVNAQDKIGQTPLHILALGDADKEIKQKAFALLVKAAGANIQIEDIKSCTPLDLISVDVESDDEIFIHDLAVGNCVNDKLKKHEDIFTDLKSVKKRLKKRGF